MVVVPLGSSDPAAESRAREEEEEEEEREEDREAAVAAVKEATEEATAEATESQRTQNRDVGGAGSRSDTTSAAAASSDVSLFRAERDLINSIVAGPQSAQAPRPAGRSWKRPWRKSDKEDDRQSKATGIVAGLSKQSRPRDLPSRFRLEREAQGFGGYGQVFLASDKLVAGRTVAVKVLEGQSKRLTASFQHELQALTSLDHPNIVRLHYAFQCGLGSQKASHALVLEHLAGGDAFDLLSSRGPLPEALVSCIMRQVVLALEYAHGRGFAHRDVKPENICLCSQDAAAPQVKLIDWGTASHFTANAMTEVVGQPPYAAPEMFGATPYTSACDMWSTGVTAYVLLSSKQPFWGPRGQQLECARAESFPIDNFGWSTDAKEFLVQMLRFNPARRPSAKAALQTSFLYSKKSKEEPALARKALENMQRFELRAPPLVQLALLTASYLDNSVLGKLSEVFDWLDVDHRGILSKRDLRRGFWEVFGSRSERRSEFLDPLFAHMDRLGADHISFTEFCAMCIGPGIHADDDALLAACQHIDTGIPALYSSSNADSSKPHSTTSSSMLSVCSTISNASSGGACSPLPPKRVCRSLLAKEALARFASSAGLAISTPSARAATPARTAATPSCSPSPAPTPARSPSERSLRSSPGGSAVDDGTCPASRREQHPIWRFQPQQSEHRPSAGSAGSASSSDEASGSAFLITEWLSDARRPDAPVALKTNQANSGGAVRRLGSSSRRMWSMLGSSTKSNCEAGFEHPNKAKSKSNLVTGLFPL